MRLPTITAASMLVILIATSTSAQQPVLNHATGRWYTIVGPGDYATCEAQAQAQGGSLASLEGIPENDFVKTNVCPLVPILPGLGRQAYIGLSDYITTGTFQWSTGASLTYNDWNVGEPNNIGIEHVVEFVPVGSTFRWNNLPDTTIRYGIAELPTFVFENSATGSRYRFTSVRMGWNAARAEAESLGGHLVKFDDNLERLYIQSTMLQYIPSAYFAWIGLNDVAVEGDFRWHDGTVPTVTHWLLSQPSASNPDDDYVAAGGPAFNYQWDDLADVFPFYGIIEICIPHFDISAYNGPGSLRVETCSPLHHGQTAITIVTTNPIGYGAGWFYGINPSFFEIVAEINAGFPFVATLNTVGTTTFDIPSGVPAGLYLAGVSVVIDASGFPLTRVGIDQITTP